MRGFKKANECVSHNLNAIAFAPITAYNEREILIKN